MSDGLTPKSRLDSGEMAAKTAAKMGKTAVTVLGILALLAPPTIYIVRLPSKADVQLMIQAAAPNKSEFGKAEKELTALKITVGAMSTGTQQRMDRLERRLLKRLDRIEGKLDGMGGRATRERGRQSR